MPAPTPSPAVYRRRRLVALVLLLAVIGLVWWGVAALIGAIAGGGEPAPGGTGAAPAPAPSAPVTAPPTTGAPATDAPEPTPTEPPEPQRCTADDVVVTARTDAEFYGPDAQPQFSMSLENRSEHDCIIDVGTAAQEYRVTSGSDVIWVSTHCQQEAEHQDVLLEAGRTVDAPGLGWVRERSTPDTCDGERPAAVAGNAYYHLQVTIGGIASTPVVFVLE
ncbi:MAG: hypothetical protein GXX90_11605 [Microbacteriaceae bacterium]|nr:hypothetical protein [Microbacteriaceae bacterium]